MEEKEILQQAAKAITQDAFTFEVDVISERRYGYFFKKKREEKRAFSIQPLKLGTLERISVMLLDIGVTISDFKEDNILFLSYKLASGHAAQISKIVALAVTNTEAMPPSGLATFFLWHLDVKELSQVMAIVIKQMEVGNFVSTTVSMCGLNILPSVEQQPEKEAGQ